MTNLAKSVSKTKLSGLETQKIIARSIIKAIKRFPERKEQYKLSATILRVDHLIPQFLN